MKDELDDSIQRYVDGEMSEAEARDFLQSAKTNPDLAEELELTEDLIKAVEFNAARDLKHKLANLDRTTSTSINITAWYKIAASILLIFTVGYLLFNNTSLTGDDIYNEHYSPYPNIVNPLSRSETTVNADGIILYEQEQYAEAVALLLAKLKSNNGNDTLNFYLAQSYLGLEEYENALNYLERVHNSSIFIEPATWYTGLVYLKLHDQKAAVATFRILEHQRGSYADEATAILEKL